MTADVPLRRTHSLAATVLRNAECDQARSEDRVGSFLGG